MFLRAEPPAGRRRGAAPLWLLLLLAALAFVWVVTRLEGRAAAAGFGTIDPTRVSLDLPAGTEGLPPSWREVIAARLARHGPRSAGDEDLLEEVRAELAALPFVREVGEARVLWPDGLEVAVRVREPVACVCAGEDYLPVSRDAVVLPGRYPGPPDLGRGLLPVLGPVDGSLRQVRPGDTLLLEHHLDALSVAVSLREHLSLERLAVLGPVVIDAEQARRTAVDEPGTRLLLEEHRVVLYGRTPRQDAPGELPEAVKWTHLARALDLLVTVEGVDSGAAPDDWDLLDLRWDEPTLRPGLGYR